MIMAADASKEIQFEIGHVLFTDIVGYSKVSVNERYRAAYLCLMPLCRARQLRGRRLRSHIPLAKPE